MAITITVSRATILMLSLLRWTILAVWRSLRVAIWRALLVMRRRRRATLAMWV